MDPLPIAPQQWDRLAGLLVDLTASAGLALTAAFAFLLGHVVVPAVADADQNDETQRHDNVPAVRWLLDQMAAAAAVAMLVGLGRAAVNAVDVVQSFSPHSLI